MSTPAGAARTLCFLAFDFGTLRVGVATGNTLLGSAQALTTIAAKGDARWLAIDHLIKQWLPDALVLGVPTHPDGTPHENTRLAQRFGRQLHGRFHLPVHEVDERWSTTEALSQRAHDVDATAAAIILGQYLRARETAHA